MRVPTSIIVAIYLVGAFATFGWQYNTYDGYDRSFDRGLSGFIGGAVWPLYWGGYLGIKWVHP